MRSGSLLKMFEGDCVAGGESYCVPALRRGSYELMAAKGIPLALAPASERPDVNNDQDRYTPTALRPDEIIHITRDPITRFGDVPGGFLLAEQLSTQGRQPDPHLEELFMLVVRDQHAKALITTDPLYGNAPPAGALPPCRGRIPLVGLCTGAVLSICLPDLTKNLLVVGPTGGGKTNFLRSLIVSMLEASE